MKRAIINLSLISLLSVTMLSLLVYWTNDIGAGKNGFKRNWIDYRSQVLREKTLSQSLLNISGVTRYFYYFSTKEPGFIIRTNSDLTLTDTLNFRFPSRQPLLSGFTTDIDSPNVSLFIPNMGTVLNTKFGDSFIVKTKLTTPLFTRVTKISPDKIIARAFDTTRHTQKFYKYDLRTGAMEREIDIIKDQGDGGFSGDGQLLYDDSYNLVVYVSYYENKFYVLDTNLNLSYIGKTIDTTNTNPVLTKSFSDEKKGSLMPSVPLKPINMECSVFGGKLYVASNLQADNENDNSFLEHTVIDIYQISNGAYIGSFYIPNKNGKRPIAFRIYEFVLIALYDRDIRLIKVPSY